MQYLPLIFLFGAVLVAGYLYLHQASTVDAGSRGDVQQADPTAASRADRG